MSVRLEAIKLPEKNICVKLLDIGLSNDVLNLDIKSKSNKSKNKQVGLHKTKKFLHGNGNYQQNEKVT